MGHKFHIMLVKYTTITFHYTVQLKDYQYHVQLPMAVNRLFSIYWIVVHLHLNNVMSMLAHLVLCCVLLFLQCSPLLLAATHGFERVVQILLEYDEIDVNEKSTTGYNCLCEAIMHGHR